MQPYFFPYLGYFGLIAQVDRWIVFDVTQYTPKSWMNRNRILHPAGGAQYITVALSNSSISIKTSEARILDREASRQNILGKLTSYRRRAPYYAQVTKLVEETFNRCDGDSLVALNVAGLVSVCNYLGMPFFFDICSRMHLNLRPALGPGDWAPEICELIGACEYLNPIGGRHLFSVDEFSRRGIQLKFLDYERFFYSVACNTFEPDLSILDVLMWNNPRLVSDHLLGMDKRIIAAKGALH